MPDLKTWVDELMIYDLSEDKLSSNEAKHFLASGGSKGAEGIKSVTELGGVLKRYVNLKQLSFCTHGYPGGVAFPQGNLTAANLKSVPVPANLFRGEGRLLFMGCETARTKEGEAFLVAAGQHFFAGKGGVVGGSTVYNLGYSSGTVLPMFGGSSSTGVLPERGKLILFRLDASGKVTTDHLAMSLQFHERLIRIDPQAAIDRRDKAEGPVGLGGRARKRPQDGACVEVQRVQRAGG